MIFSNARDTYATRNVLVTLDAAEQHDFELIVRSAKASAWLDDSCIVTAARMEFEVIIIFAIGRHTQTHVYEWNSRWLYRFLCDLAHGHWKELHGRRC
jgi:hypothetical protein